MSPTKQKILLLLMAGLAFSFSYTYRRQWKILKETAKEWRKIDEKKLREEIRKLYQNKWIEKKENPDGSYTISLATKGKLKALTYHFLEMKIERKNWDDKWRIVVFDIPEEKKEAREFFRKKLKELEFYQFQESVFIFPFPCEKEIKFLREIFEVPDEVKIILAQKVENEDDLREMYGL